MRIAAVFILIFIFTGRVFSAELSIVLDPGHGGEDAGAIGVSGTKEKDIALGIALKLKDELIKRDNGAEVFLTRSNDTFIPLKERTDIANEKEARIFISIHANAARKAEAKGAETFFMSYRASDEDAQRTSAIENNPMAMLETAVEDNDDIKAILTDMTRTETHHESSLLALLIQERLFNITGGAGRGVKQAPFVVLTKARMPAVLVEVGFISNPAEEKKLMDKDYQTTLVSAICDSIDEFKKATQQDIAGVPAGRLANGAPEQEARVMDK
ncbi:MAG: N-acetylmuramoyl-L-alanine amidase [Deltaproteobacteria bacterium]|nr:N-acetylmuramoyl-L-alanine amidase [Deltaproteobacteria bacterium]